MLSNVQRAIGIWGGLASILSLIGILLIKGDAQQVALSMAFLGAMALAAFLVFVISINAYLRKSSPEGFNRIASFTRYQTSDGKQIIYDVYKFVQARRAWLTEYEHRFYWTGPIPPTAENITSEMQKVVRIEPGGSEETSKLFLEFRRPLRYNEAAVVHARFKLSDPEHRSQPFVSTQVKSPTDVLRWAVELAYKTDADAAVVERKKISAPESAAWEHCTVVPFNTLTRAYEHYIHAPQTGFVYRLRWERS